MPLLPDSSSPRPRQQRTFPWGLFFCGYCAIILVAQLIHQSAIKPLWRDELFTYFEVHDKTCGEIIQSLKTGVNLLPPTYFLLLSALLHFTDFTPLLGWALGCSFILATVPVMWLALRRTAGTLITAIAISGVVFCSPLIYYHNSEARPYGFFLFAAGMVAWAFARSVQEERLSSGTLVLLVVANALLPSVNYIGGLYSAAALAVTFTLDLAARRMRWRVYGAYLGGWALFAVLVLPLCLAQYRMRGTVGTNWLPDFYEAVLILGKQWAKTLIPFAVVVVPFAIWLTFGQYEPKVNQSSERQGDLSAWSLAALGLAWLFIPVFFIGQSLLTHRNMYMDRYFIASDLGLLLLLAALASLACARWRGTATIETAVRAPWHRGFATAVAVGFVVIASLRFYWNGRNELWGTGDAVYACKAWPGPKATFSLSYYIEGHVRTGPDMHFILLSQHPSDRDLIGAYCRDFEIREFDGLAVFPEFVYVDSREAPPDFNLQGWAQTHNYAIEQVGFYKETHDPKRGIFRLKRTAVTAQVLGPAGRSN